MNSLFTKFLKVFFDDGYLKMPGSYNGKEAHT